MKFGAWILIGAVAAVSACSTIFGNYVATPDETTGIGGAATDGATTTSHASGSGGDSCTDVDCGGSCSAKCADGKKCEINSDCVHDDCYGGVCVSCVDGIKDGDETATDCGGSCATKCADGNNCQVGGDCAHNDCFGGICISCVDGIKNGNETDTDCGGGCEPCSFGDSCLVPGDCKSGFCVGQKCGADTLASGQTSPQALAVDAANLYWVTQGSMSSATGTVMKLSLAGTTAVPLATYQNEPTAITIDATFVYWCNNGDSSGANGSVWKVAISGGTPINMAMNQGAPSTIVLDGSTAYWGLAGFGGYGAGGIEQEPVGSTSGTPVLMGLTVRQMVTDIGGGNALLYYVNDANPGQPTVESYNIFAGTNITEVMGEEPSVIAADVNNLYWASLVTGGGSIRKQATATSNATTISPATFPVSGMALDSTFVYWTQGSAGGSVMKAPIAGTTMPTVLAPGQDSPLAIAVDGTYVYWTNIGDNTVNRVLK